MDIADDYDDEEIFGLEVEWDEHLEKFIMPGANIMVRVPGDKEEQAIRVEILELSPIENGLRILTVRPVTVH